MDEKKVREAIKLMEHCIEIQEKCKRVTHANVDAINEDIAAYKVAIEALEKQLPKKPKQADEQRIRYCTTHVCPGCGKEFTGMVSGYCYHCGQRIEYDD